MSVSGVTRTPLASYLGRGGGCGLVRTAKLPDTGRHETPWSGQSGTALPQGNCGKVSVDLLTRYWRQTKPKGLPHRDSFNLVF